MNLKEFFKPTKKKFLIFFVLFVIGQSLLLPVLSAQSAMCKAMYCEGNHYNPLWAPCRICGDPTLTVHLRTVITYIFNPLLFLNERGFMNMIFQELFSIFYLYSVSCLLTCKIRSKQPL